MDELDCKELRKQKVRDAKTNLILDAALEVLSKKGYYETRLEDIAEKAGFSKSALYRYYKDKDEIFFTIVVRERKKVIDRLSTDPEYKIGKENHISENLRRILTVAFSAWGENFSFILTLNSFQIFTLINELQKQNDLEGIQKEFITCENELAELMIYLLDDAKARGEIKTKVNSELVFDIFQGVIFTKVKKWYQMKKMENIPEAVDEIVAFFSGGLGFEYR